MDSGFAATRRPGITVESFISDDLYKDPLSLFRVKGRTAVITGATGAFGAMAA
jgi:hypothetical protein